MQIDNTTFFANLTVRLHYWRDINNIKIKRMRTVRNELSNYCMVYRISKR